jgi:hypothetical protein
MLRNTLMMMGLVVLSSVSSAMAGAVQWAGVINSKSGNPTFNLGTIPPSVNFSGVFNTSAVLANQGVFTGSLLFGSQSYNITVGSISRVNPTTLQFEVQQVNNDRNISFTATFNGSFGSWGLGDNAGLDAVLGSLLLNGDIGTVNMVELSGVNLIGAYGGTIQAVPEPSSALALLGLGVGMGIRYRRKLRSAFKK